MKQKLLFFGELPHGCLNGISKSNALNLDILREHFEIYIVEEHGCKSGIKKIISLFANIITITKICSNDQFARFYTSLAVSRAGVLKTLMVLLVFNFFSKSSRNNAKSILHIHRGDFFEFYSGRINKLLIDCIFKNTNTVLVLSESYCKSFKVKFPNVKVEVLHNTVEKQILNYKKINFGSKRFVFLSNYIRTKGIIELLEVFSELAPKYDLTLECYGAFLDYKLRPDILKFGSDRIKINNTIDGDEKYNTIVESDCIILPSWSEGQPLIILEAMACGVPIIASRVGFVADMLWEDYPLYVRPSDCNHLREQIINFVKLANKEELSSILSQRFAVNFEHEKHAKQLINFFC